MIILLFFFNFCSLLLCPVCWKLFILNWSYCLSFRWIPFNFKASAKLVSALWEKKKTVLLSQQEGKISFFSPLNGNKAQVTADQTGVELKEVNNSKGWLNGIRHIFKGVRPGWKAAVKSELVTDMDHGRERGVFSSWMWQCVSWLQETSPGLLPRVFYKHSLSSWSFQSFKTLTKTFVHCLYQLQHVSMGSIDLFFRQHALLKHMIRKIYGKGKINIFEAWITLIDNTYVSV